MSSKWLIQFNQKQISGLFHQKSSNISRYRWAKDNNGNVIRGSDMLISITQSWFWWGATMKYFLNNPYNESLLTSMALSLSLELMAIFNSWSAYDFILANFKKICIPSVFLKRHSRKMDRNKPSFPILEAYRMSAGFILCFI